MARLRKLLPSLVAEGRRVLLFSQWTQILDLLEVFLNRCLNMDFLRLDGGTNITDRQPIIDRFTAETSIPVMLISTRAGGLGYGAHTFNLVPPHPPLTLHTHTLYRSMCG